MGFSRQEYWSGFISNLDYWNLKSFVSNSSCFFPSVLHAQIYLPEVSSEYATYQNPCKFLRKYRSYWTYPTIDSLVWPILLVIFLATNLSHALLNTYQVIGSAGSVWYCLSLLGMCVLSCVRLFAAPWAVAYQASLPMECFMQEYWSGVPFLTLGALLDSGIEPGSPALAGRFLTITLPGKPVISFNPDKILCLQHSFSPGCTSKGD